MPLVDYNSSDSDRDSASGTDGPPPKKKPRRRTRATASPPQPPQPRPEPETSAAKPKPAGSTPELTTTLPPLPPSFHNLYASTVRTTTHDDPSLHQGRTRQNPHTPGRWPSHIYIEWHPPPAIHSLLTSLVTSLQHEYSHPQQHKITSFLCNDLAAPLPLHISLSRPVMLATEEKGVFLGEVERRVVGGAATAFELGCGGAVVEWHRTGESGRSFLVLRVRSRSRGSSSSQTQEGGDSDSKNPNPELTGLLRRCNEVVAAYGQPGLYQWASDSASSTENDGEKQQQIGEAFHVSIAWSFAELSEELLAATERVFGGRETRQKLREVRVPVDGIKVKIGNVVTQLALRQPGTRASGKGARNLLGL